LEYAIFLWPNNLLFAFVTNSLCRGYSKNCRRGFELRYVLLPLIPTVEVSDPPEADKLQGTMPFDAKAFANCWRGRQHQQTSSY